MSSVTSPTSLWSSLAQRLRAGATGMGTGAATPKNPWLGVQVGQQAAVAALALASHDGRPQVRLLPPIAATAAGALPASGLAAWKQAIGPKPQVTVLLAASQYQVMPVEALSVPAAELREAVRWQLAPQLDFAAEEASLDLLSLPSLPGQQAQQRQQHFAVVTQMATVRERIAPFTQAGLRVAAIDIPEMALRNLSVLAAGEHAHGLVHIGLRHTRLALVWQRELCSVRQLDLSALQLQRTPAHERQALFERLALDIQRTVDSFSRQFAGQELQGLWLSSSVEPEEVADALALLLPTRVHVYELARHVQVQGDIPLANLQLGWDYTLAVGAALRTPGATQAASDVAAQASKAAEPALVN